MTLIKAYIPIRAKEAGLSCWENINWDVGIIMVWGAELRDRHVQINAGPVERLHRPPVDHKFMAGQGVNFWSADGKFSSRVFGPPGAPAPDC